MRADICAGCEEHRDRGHETVVDSDGVSHAVPTVWLERRRGGAFAAPYDAWIRRCRQALRVAVVAAVIAGCGILGPATELEVSNDTGAALEVRAAACGAELETWASLRDGERGTREVEPGCWQLEGWTDDGRAGTVTITVAEGSLHRVPFTR